MKLSHTSAATAAVVDIDDTIVEVHGYGKQGAGFGYTGVRGLNALIATVSSDQAAPVIVAQRLRKGSSNSARGAARLVRDALKTVRILARDESTTGGRVLVRAHSAYYGHPVIGSAVKAGAEVSVTVRLDARVKAAISGIGEDAWTTIEYPQAVFDEESGVWISSAQVAGVPYVAFTSKKKAERVPGRLVVRRIPDADAEKKKRAGQDGLFELWRHHAFFTTTDEDIADTVTADKVHRAHAVIEQVHADLKSSALAHLPSGEVHRERRLAGPGGHGVQPHPRRRRPHRHPPPRPSDDGDRAAHPDHHPGPGRDLRPTNRPAPTPSLALEARLASAVRARPRTTGDSHDLTTHPPRGATQGPPRGTPRQRGRPLTPARTPSPQAHPRDADIENVIGGSGLSHTSHIDWKGESQNGWMCNQDVVRAKGCAPCQRRNNMGVAPSLSRPWVKAVFLLLPWLYLGVASQFSEGLHRQPHIVLAGSSERFTLEVAAAGGVDSVRTGLVLDIVFVLAFLAVTGTILSRQSGLWRPPAIPATLDLAENVLIAVLLANKATEPMARLLYIVAIAKFVAYLIVAGTMVGRLLRDRSRV